VAVPDTISHLGYSIKIEVCPRYSLTVTAAAADGDGPGISAPGGGFESGGGSWPNG